VTFAALLNCLDPQYTGEADRPVQPCRKCRHCRAIFDLAFEGLFLAVPIPPHKNMDEAIDLTNQLVAEKKKEPFRIPTSSANMSIPIDVAREIARRLSRKAGDGITRVVLFYQMEKMRTQSADALLKLIEEPPPDTVLLLTAERAEMLLPTIRSRSQIINLRRLPEPIITDYLKENYGLSDSRATLLSRLSDGVMGRAVELAGSDDEDHLSRRAVGMLLFKSLFNEPGPNVISLVTEMVNVNNRGEAEELLRLWLSLIRDCHYYTATGADTDLINIDFTAELKQLSQRLGEVRLADAMVGIIKNTLADFRRNVHIQTALAALSLKLKAAVAAAE
jgi:DNA polymerase-3 subunit delta'